MATRPTGHVIEKSTSQGRSYAIRFRALGRRQFVHLGYADQGWTYARAADHLQTVMAQVRLGEWKPPAPAQVETERPDPTFHEFASDWFDAKRREIRPTTAAAYEYELAFHLLPFFKDHRLSQITIAEVKRYKTAKLKHAEKKGVRLSNETINKTLARLAQILEDAVDDELIDRNPAKGRKRRCKVDRPDGTYLDRTVFIAALLNAAGELDREARADRGAGRRALLATLMFAGLRIGEALSLRWRDVDLAGGRIHVRDSKTSAGVRRVDLRAGLRDELAAHKARSADISANALVFATTEGRRQSESNVRNRILAKAIDRANARLEEAGETPLPDRLTPHSLRRTFASILIAVGEDLLYVKRQLGHARVSDTWERYAQEWERRPGELAALRALVGDVVDDGEPVVRSSEAVRLTA